MKKLVFAALLIPVMGHATTFSCKAIQEGHIDSGSQKVSVDSTFDIQDKKMGNDSNLLIVFYVQIMPDDFVMQLHRF